MRDFIWELFRPVAQFGRNFFKVRIGTGAKARIVIGAFHLLQITGDGKELDALCGTHWGKKCMCRMCLEIRPSLFLTPSEPAARRLDAFHENLSYERLQVDKRYLSGGGSRETGGRKTYQGKPADFAVIKDATTYSIAGGDNRVYELFYGLNCLGLGGMHAACWPDILHVVLKGIVEKTLSHILILVQAIEKHFPESHGSAMSLLDQRVSCMEPVYFDWMRWVSFSNGLSQLLKVEISSSGHTSTGLLSGSLHSWKYLSALFQAMICIGKLSNYNAKYVL